MKLLIMQFSAVSCQYFQFILICSLSGMTAVTQMTLNQLTYQSMRIANLNRQARPVLSNLVPEALQRDHYHHVLG